jgi:predicted RNase H-like HicB family nuclease
MASFAAQEKRLSIVAAFDSSLGTCYATVDRAREVGAAVQFVLSGGLLKQISALDGLKRQALDVAEHIELICSLARARSAAMAPGEDGQIVATVPTLNGCISQGRTQAEALANVSEAAEACVEDAADNEVARARKDEPTIPWEDVKAKLNLDEKTG